MTPSLKKNYTQIGTVDIKTGVCIRSRDEPGGCPLIGQVVSGIEAT
jgi:hypothetical protein